MAMWQLSAARSGVGGSRSAKPRLLVRETVQKSRKFVWRISALGRLMSPTLGTKRKVWTRLVNGHG